MTSCTEMAFFPTNFILQTATSNEEEEGEDPHMQNNHHPHISLTPFFPPCAASHHDFQGSMLGKRSMSFSGGVEDSACDHHHHHHHHQEGNVGEDDLSDEDGSQLGGEKKRRLNLEQVKTLEKNFELGNKLEPERKMQLARSLGLQPRQIAIWFQNRRARWKTKQLEKDYDVLKRQFDALKVENDALQAQNHKLQSQLISLKAGLYINHHHHQNPVTDQSINLNKLETDQESDQSSSDVVIMKPDISMVPNSSSSATPDQPAAKDCSRNSRVSLFPPAPIRAMAAHQLFQDPSPNSSTSNIITDQLHNCSKINQDPAAVKEESFSNMFCGIDDQTGFWPWLEPQHFN